MATPVEAPKLGNTVEECLIGTWLKRAGERVAAGDVVAEIETDKATFEVTAPVSGTILATFFEEGALVPVFTNLLVIGEPGENIDAFRPTTQTQAAKPAARAELDSSPAFVEQRPNGAPGAPFSPRARRFAEAHNFHPAAVAGSGPGGRALAAELRLLYQAVPAAPA